jgi:2-desacetyl-2-hydroxyethyl bacteriochlorophyllide A dehydrogenase
MRAVLFHGTGKLEVVDRPSPTLGPDEVRLKVERSGICGSDIATYKGDWPTPVIPCLKGHEVCASVLETGAEVEGLAPGQLVAVRPIRGCGVCRHCARGNYSRCADFKMHGLHLPGGWAEEMVVRKDHARPLAPHVTADQGLFSEPIAVIAHAFNLAGSLEGASVAILGAGVLGLIAIQVAKARGASRVFATGRQDKKLALARQFGAATADARTDDVVKVGLEHGGPYDVVLDCIGTSAALNDAILLSEKGGWIVLVAGPHEGADLRFSYVEHRLREVAVIASRIYGEDFDDCLGLLAGGSLDLAPLLTHRYAVDDAVEAMAFAASNRADAIKVALQPADSL